MKTFMIGATLLLALVFAACEPPEAMPEEAAEAAEVSAEAEDLLAKYTTVTLNADLSVLTERERQMIPLLIEAGQAMEEIFWRQAYGDKDALMASIDDPGLRRFAEINYGPWDRLDANAPFVSGVGEKPKGANLYPADITEEELEAAAEAPALSDGAPITLQAVSRSLGIAQAIIFNLILVGYLARAYLHFRGKSAGQDQS